MRLAESWFVAAVLLVGCTDFVGVTDPQTSDSGSDSGATTDASTETSTNNPSTSGSDSDSLGGSTSDDPSDGSTTHDDPTVTEGSTTDDPGSVCGNGQQERGEECDDGNANDRDGCSNRCTSTSCEDGVLNGDETDVDCGGSCLTPCEVGEGCRATRDCDNVVCDLGRNVCAEASCTDGLQNQGELGIDCGVACNTSPTNVIINGDFELNDASWDTVAPEVNPQNNYFGDGSNNRIMEIDRDGNSTSSWRQDFEVTPDDVGLVRTLTLDVGDRNNEPGDVGGLFLSILDPGGTPVSLSGISGAGFMPGTGNLISVDAQQTGSFSTAVVQFTPSMAGTHTLELVEETDGQGLGNGGGIVVDDVSVAMIVCP